MRYIEELESLYSDYLLGCAMLPANVSWALARLISNEDEGDLDIAMLASSRDSEEIIRLTRTILAQYGHLAELELGKEELIARLHSVFPLSPAPYPITGYEEDDPRDYDGEGQSVTDFFFGKDWVDLDLDSLCGFHLTYLNEKALNHYFPAFVLALISNKYPYTDFVERFYSFIGEGVGGFNPKVVNVLVALSREQRKLLRQALNFGAQKHGIDWGDCCRIRDNIK